MPGGFSAKQRLLINVGRRKAPRIYCHISVIYAGNTHMLDEPTAALDRENRAALLENIISFSQNNGKTLIIVSHDDTLTQNYAENIINLENG